MDFALLHQMLPSLFANGQPMLVFQSHHHPLQMQGIQ